MDKIKQAEETTILLEHLSSIEFYQNRKTLKKLQILKDITFAAAEGDIRCVICPQTLPIKILLDIIANVRSYKSGKCHLLKLGMMKKKRQILSHLFYIADTNLFYDDMEVFEYLHLILNDIGNSRQQKALLRDRLIHFNLEYLCNSTIKNISAHEKSVILLFISLYSRCNIIIWNLPRLNYSEELIQSIKLICDELSFQKKTLLIGTNDYRLADAVSTHIVTIENGYCTFSGTYNSLINTYDTLSYIMEVDEISEDVFQLLSEKFFVKKENNTLYFHRLKNVSSLIKDMDTYNIHPITLVKHVPNLKDSLDIKWRVSVNE